MVRAVRWKLVGKRTKAERRDQRKNIILRDAGITEKTQSRYYVALGMLLQFLTTPFSTLDMDEQICDWIQSCWEEGESIHIVSDGLCGLHHFEPWTKRTIPMSWKLFGIWRKLESPDRAPPLTKSIIYSWANYALDHNHYEFGALLLLGFFALLRTGELLQVRPKDLLLTDSQGIVSLFETKTGQRDNVAEMVAFDDFLTLEFFRAVKQRRNVEERINVPIWCHSAQAFREQFKRYIHRFDLEALQFRPYSLRRGGATALFQASGSMELTMLKGRWSSNRVARIYISDAMSYLPGMTFTQKANAMLKDWDPFKFSSTC